METLTAPETVNTVPENVYEEIVSNTNQYEDLLNSDSNYHQQVIANALDENVLESITDQLLIDGIKLFEEAFDSLLDEIKNKAKKI